MHLQAGAKVLSWKGSWDASSVKMCALSVKTCNRPHCKQRRYELVWIQSGRSVAGWENFSERGVASAPGSSMALRCMLSLTDAKSSVQTNWETDVHSQIG